MLVGDIFVFRNGFQLSIAIHVASEHNHGLPIGVHNSGGCNGSLGFGASKLDATGKATGVSRLDKDEGDEEADTEEPDQNPAVMAVAEERSHAKPGLPCLFGYDRVREKGINLPSNRPSRVGVVVVIAGGHGD